MKFVYNFGVTVVLPERLTKEERQEFIANLTSAADQSASRFAGKPVKTQVHGKEPQRWPGE